MGQSAFTILTPVKPGEDQRLRARLIEIGDDIRGNPHLDFAALDDLHYASLFLVGEGTDQPFLGFEGNVDGRPGPFLEQLVDRAGDAVDAIYRHCEGYPTAGLDDRAGVIRYLQAQDIGAHTFYVNRPGRTVADIRQEQALRDHVQRFVDEHEDELAGLDPERIRQAIAASLPEDMSWAKTAAPTPFLVKHGRRVVELAVVPPVLSLVALVKMAVWRCSGRRTLAPRVALAALFGTAGAAVLGLLSVERRDRRADRDDDWQSDYAEWTANEIELGSREDRHHQNHMVSVTKVKGGWLRLTILRLVLLVLNLVARVIANKGTLGSITSIHFARWVITPQRQLVFLSNFDGGWERYLSDFVDRASPALTAVWSNSETTVGFPPARFLVGDGSRDEGRFKAYARSSMVPTYVWYSAYPDISAGNIATNMALRAGLFAPADPAATEAWLRHL